MEGYVGLRSHAGDVAVWRVSKHVAYPLAMRHDVCHHSPTGPEWGYNGSGPAQLAFAILADATGDTEVAQKLHQSFKQTFISMLPRGGWWLSTGDVEAFIVMTVAAATRHDVIDLGDTGEEQS